MIFNYLVFRTMGEKGIVVFSVINYINLLAVQMLLGITQGMQPLVSFAKGSNNQALGKLYLKFARAFAIIIVATIFSVCMLGTDWVVSQFISPNDADVYTTATRALRIFSWFLLPAGFTIVSIGYFSAIERPKCSQSLSIFRGLIGVAAIGIIMAILFGETGIWLAPVVSESITFLIAVWMLVRNAEHKSILSGPMCAAKG